MEQKLCIVTGANSGIGKHTAVGLARAGMRVVMVCRSAERGEAARAEVQRAAGTDAVDLMVCDLSRQADIRRFAAEFLARHARLDVLVNNAGVMCAERELTEDGIERTFAVNHLGYFLVTRLLRDLLVASAPARVVSVASVGHRFARFDWDNLQGERKYGETRAYSLSKLCNVAFTYQLARRLDGTGVTANCLHPGAVGSNFGSSAGVVFRSLMKVGRPLLLSPERGARTSIYLASSPDVEGVTGQYFVRCKPARSSRASRDVDAQRRLWEVSEQLTRLSA